MDKEKDTSELEELEERLSREMVEQWFGEKKQHDKVDDAEEEAEEEEEDEEDEKDIDGEHTRNPPLDWLTPPPNQNFALLAFAVPDGYFKKREEGEEEPDFAWMIIGMYDSVEEAQVVQEELLASDDRFDTYVCEMSKGMARIPPTRKEYKGRVRYRNKQMQEYYDDRMEGQTTTKRVIQDEARKRAAHRKQNADGQEEEDTDKDHGQMFPLPTTTVSSTGVTSSVIECDDIIEHGVETTARRLCGKR